MAFSYVISRSFFRVFCLMLAGLVAVAAVAGCGSEPEPAEVVSEAPVEAPSTDAPAGSAPQAKTDILDLEQPTEIFDSAPAGPTPTRVVVAPAQGEPAPVVATAEEPVAPEAAGQTTGTDSPPTAAALSYKDIGPDTTWGDVFNSFSDEEQECIRSEVGDEAVDSILERPFGLDQDLSNYGDTLVGCVSNETAREITLAEFDAQMGGLSAEQEGCLRDLLGNYQIADLAKASSPDATPEQAMQMLSYGLGLLGCLPNLAEAMAGPDSGPPAGGEPFVQDPSFLWSFPTGGWVVTAPAVAEGVVYAGSDDGALYALSADTGDMLWTFVTGDVIRSTPTVADGKVFFGSNDNHLYALDAATGAEQWRYDTGEWVQYSPTVSNGMVYLAAPSGGDRKVHGLNAATGEMVWTGEHPFPTGTQQTPAATGGKVYAPGSEYGQFFALNAATGETLWRAEVGGYVKSAPTVIDGVVYLTVINQAYALNEATGEIIWSFNTEEFPARDFPAIVVDGVYYLAPSNKVYALDASTGEEIWSYESSMLSTAPVVDAGVLYGASEDAGQIFALDVATGEELWSEATGDSTINALTAADGTLYGELSDGQLIAADAGNGIPVWGFEKGGFSDVRGYTVKDGVVYSAGPNNSVYAHRAP